MVYTDYSHVTSPGREALPACCLAKVCFGAYELMPSCTVRHGDQRCGKLE